jgi:hypothetical protein
MATRIVATALGSVMMMGLLATSAVAGAPPECFAAETWDRPGIERPHELRCQRAERVELVAGASHGTVTELAFDPAAQRATWSFRPADGAPAEDGFDLRLSGPGGSAVQHVTVHVTPRSQNTAPQCRPASEARRTDGAAPAVIELHVACWDYENDTIVVAGGGPGQHLDAPRTVRGGDAGGTDMPSWRYRTATARGEEATTFWATDDLGARSADASLTVELGPDVDRLPTCTPNLGSYDPALPYIPVFARPGATRRFGLVCSDADRDPLEVSLGTAPARGTMTTFAPGELLDFDWGTQRRVDGAYRPADASGELDPFTVVTSAHGRTSETRMAIANADAPRWTSSFLCGSADGRTTAGSPGIARISCLDEEGDPVTATVTRGPEHGVAAPPAHTAARYGVDEFTFAWTPDAGFSGVDTMTVRAADDHGVAMDLTIDLHVTPAAGSAPEPGSPLAPQPSLPAGGQPSVGQAPAVAPADQARAALRTRDVVLVRRIGDASVYARRSAVRRGLVPQAGSAALAVTCPLACRLDTRVRSTTRRHTRLARTSAGPGRAARVRLSRPVAALLRTSASAAFDVAVRMPAGRAGRGTVRLRRR